MLLEKSILNHLTIQEVVDQHILICEADLFDYDLITKRLINEKYKFVLVTALEDYAILTAHDLLAIHINHLDVITYLENEKRFSHALDVEMTLGEFLSFYENHPSRYYPVKGPGHSLGFVDKKAIISLYRQIDEDNNALITSILDNINDAICIVDTSSRVKFWNKSAEQLYEISRSVILDQVITEYFPTALLPSVIKNQEKVSNVYNLPREDAPNLISASPLYNKGVLIGAISYDKNISEQIKIAEYLKETESNLQVLQKELQQIGEERYSFTNIVGEDPKWLETIKITKMVSKSMLNILISGESGTGKEVLSRAIHIESQRKGFFVPINCSAIPKDLFESELFGYESGAFSGASNKGKMGKFVFGNGGTIFLDEIGDMPLEMQAKLLRVLEDGDVIPVGGNEAIKVDIRIISASNKDLLQMSNEGLFRKDLYYRLNGIGVHLSPLRERPSDIAVFVNKFFEDYKQTYGYRELTLPNHLMDMMQNYHWEGNIRELKNIVERLVILSMNNGLTAVSEEYLPDVIRNMAISMKIGPSYSLNDLMEKTEKEAITSALSKANSKADAAKLLKIPRSTLYFKMDKYGLKHVSKN